MPSSSVERGAARAPPPPNQIAAFYKLVDKKVTAGMLSREARDMELSAQAATQAEALFGDDSLVVATLRHSECCSLHNLAIEASGAEKEGLQRRGWDVLLSVINLLQRRIAGNTLLPGTIREEEEDYEAHVQTELFKAKNKPVPSPARLREIASTMGYNTLVQAMHGSLDL